jgi:hypothetical protein
MVENNYVVNRAHGQTFFKTIENGIDLGFFARSAVKLCSLFSKQVTSREVRVPKKSALRDMVP